MKSVQHLFPIYEQKGIAQVIPGFVTTLVVNDMIMMDDSDFEMRTNSEFINVAHGHVLIAGLGIGFVIHNILPKVKSITVLEDCKDVIDIVGPKFRDPRIHILNEDVFEWIPPREYDCIYFDIWPVIIPEFIEEMQYLEKIYSSYLKSNGYMQSWQKMSLVINEFIKHKN